MIAPAGQVMITPAGQVFELEEARRIGRFAGFFRGVTFEIRKLQKRLAQHPCQEEAGGCKVYITDAKHRGWGERRIICWPEKGQQDDAGQEDGYKDH